MKPDPSKYSCEQKKERLDEIKVREVRLDEIKDRELYKP